MDCSPPVSTVQRILQARILEWVAMPSSRDLPNPGIKPASLMSPALAGGFFPASTTWEARLHSTKSNCAIDVDHICCTECWNVYRQGYRLDCQNTISKGMFSIPVLRPFIQSGNQKIQTYPSYFLVNGMHEQRIFFFSFGDCLTIKTIFLVKWFYPDTQLQFFFYFILLSLDKASDSWWSIYSLPKCMFAVTET